VYLLQLVSFTFAETNSTKPAQTITEKSVTVTRLSVSPVPTSKPSEPMQTVHTPTHSAIDSGVAVKKLRNSDSGRQSYYNKISP